MASLTETAYYARQGIKFGSLGFVLILVLWFAGTGFVAWYKAAYPAPPPPPRQEFGTLNPIIFPDSTRRPESYELRTPDGTLGRYSDRVNVFYAPTKRSSFGDAAMAKQLASELGFETQPEVSFDTEYNWTGSDPLPVSLKIDIVSNHFLLRRQWSADPSLIIDKRFISDQQIILEATTWLRGLNLNIEDLFGQEEVSYYRTSASDLLPAISLSESDFVRVDFFRKDYQIIDEETKQVLASYPFYTSDPKRGIVSILLSGSSESNKKIIETEYNYSVVDYETKGSYPLKKVQLAYEELQAGGGYVASFDGSGPAIVRRVALGYYDATDNQEYAMPIYVFTGDDNLVAYVSALSDGSLKVSNTAN